MAILLNLVNNNTMDLHIGPSAYQMRRTIQINMCIKNNI